MGDPENPLDITDLAARTGFRPMPPPCNSRHVADDCNVFARYGRVVYGVRETDRPVTFTQSEKWT